jgi:hypothetical protein
MITETVCVTMVVVGLVTFCLGIFVESTAKEGTPSYKQNNGLIFAILGILIIVLGVFGLTGYRAGLNDGYRNGQVDALRGVVKYERKLTIEPFKIREEIVEKPPNK